MKQLRTKSAIYHFEFIYPDIFIVNLMPLNVVLFDFVNFITSFDLVTVYLWCCE